MRVILVLVAAACAARAQVDSAAISGTVSDRTGAVIPGAKVSILQLDTNQHTDLTTNDSGFYSAPSLRPGRYQISVAKDGFQRQKSQEFELRVQDRAEMNFPLDVGTANTEVTVMAAAPLLESDTSSLGQVVEGKTITELPLNGRSFIQLATLTAGTLPSTRSAERDNFISNGMRAVQNSYLLDGVDNRNRIMGYDNSSAQAIQPVVDSIQEFKVQTATFSAEFGQAAGGVVNVTTRSGTNSLHGSLFEFLRNNQMDATPYFQPAGTGNPLFIQNQFGATVGGPVIRDRTFFFGAWQSSRELSASPQVATVPTLAMRQGILPGRVTDPVSKLPFPDNTIPRDRWDPVAAALFPLYPLPALPVATRNYAYNPKERLNGDQYILRGDHRIGSRDFTFVRFSQNWNDNVLPTPLPAPANQQGYVNVVARSMSLSETHPFAPNKVNEFRFGYSFSENIQDTTSPRLFDQFGIKGALDTPEIKGLPNFTINGLANLGTGPQGTAPIPAAGSTNWPSDKIGKSYQIMDTFSWVMGRHTVKFGTDLQRISMHLHATNQARPPFNFNGTYTGSGLGDFLLGYVYSVSTSQLQTDTILQHVFTGYVQDDWKATGKLTINAGLRYEQPKPWIETRDHQSNFILDLDACNLRLLTAAEAGQCGLGRSLVRTDTNNFAPRFGLAYQARARTVIRSGFGMFYGRDEGIGIQRRLPNNLPFITSASFTGTQTTPAIFLKDGLPSNALTINNGNNTLNQTPVNNPTGYVLQWNLNVEHQIARDLVAQIGYTGSGAHKLLEVLNVNQGFPGTTALALRRPYQGYGDIMYYGPRVNSNYQALLAKLERRFSSGISLLASYTYGHSIDDGKNNNDQNDPVAQDVRNLRANKGASNFDVRHRFVTSGFYQLPFGKGKGPFAYAIRGWQLSGILSLQTGQPFTPTLSTDPSGTGTTAHPDRIADGALPADERSVNRWFDITAFRAPVCVCFGNSGRGILRAPGFMNLDLGVSREFRFHERYRVQLRGEAFNLMNHPNLGLPNVNIGNPQAGIINTVINPERQMQVALKLSF